MESPFKNHSSVVMYLEPFLNSYTQNYQNIITFSNMPHGPLSNMVSMISSPKLSSFQYLNNGNNGNNVNNCIYVLLRYPKNNCGGGNGCLKNPDFFMGSDDIPSIFGYLRTNGYSIDTEITKMMNKSRVLVGGVSDTRFSGDRKMISMFSYNGG